MISIKVGTLGAGEDSREFSEARIEAAPAQFPPHARRAHTGGQQCAPQAVAAGTATSTHRDPSVSDHESLCFICFRRTRVLTLEGRSSKYPFHTSTFHRPSFPKPQRISPYQLPAYRWHRSLSVHRCH